MKYASFLSADRTPTWGVVVDETVFDLGPSGLGLAPDLRTAIADGLFGSVDEQHRGAPARPVGEVELLPVIPDPAKIICIGVNYRTHQKETGKGDQAQTAPTVFTRFADTQMGRRPAGASCPRPPPSSTTRARWPWSSARKPSTSVPTTRGSTWPATRRTTTSPPATGSAPPASGPRARTSRAPAPSGPTWSRPPTSATSTPSTLETRVNGDVRQKASRRRPRTSPSPS